MITIVVILYCNQTFVKELHKGIWRYGNTGETHDSKLVKIGIFVRTCLILKKEEFSLLHPVRSNHSYILNLCIYIKLSQLKTVGLLITKIENIWNNTTMHRKWWALLAFFSISLFARRNASFTHSFRLDTSVVWSS